MAKKPRPINSNVGRYFDMMRDISAYGSTLNPNVFATDMALARQKKQEYEDFLGKTDYSGKLKESEDLAKMQLGLALAQRGFAAMGAQPRRGESAIGVLGRTLAAPLAGDLSTVAGRLMQQRQAVKLAEQQEERQLKLSALTAATAEGKERRALAIKLMEEAGEDSLDSKVRYLIRPKSEGDGYEFVPQKGPNKKMGRTQLRLQKGTGEPYNIQSQLFQRVLPGQVVVSADELKKYGLSSEVTGTGKTASLGAVDYKLFYTSGPNKGKPYTVKGRSPVYATATKGEKNIPIGSFVERGGMGRPFSLEDLKNKNLEARKVVKPTAATKPTTEDVKRKDRANLLLSSMSEEQSRPLGGAFSRRSALYFDQSAFLQNKSPWRFIPPNTDPRDRSKDVIITDPKVLQLIDNKVTAAAQGILRSDFGSANQEIKTKRLADAVKSILGSSPETLLGTSSIPEIGTRGGQTVGYSPSPAAFNSANVNQNVRTAMTALRQPDNQDIDAGASLSGLPYPRNNADLNKPWGRARAASELFPSAFEIISPDDVEMIQRRYDIEKILPNVRLVAGADSTDHRALIQAAFVKKAEARNKLQNSVDARLAKENFGYAQEFRRALIDFKNAAAETGVEGFFTGRVAETLSRVGLADFIAGDGAEHWNRLTIASDRFQDGISRRVGRDFGDNRISNYDAEAYKKLVADIKKGAKFNRVLIEDGLKRVLRDMTSLMSYGGKVGWTERELKQAAEAGVDFSELKTMEDWHGYGYYGKNRYATTRQQSPALSQDDRNNIRTQGQLKDSMYGNKYTTPTVNYSTDRLPTFRLPGDRNPTPIKRFDSFEFDQYIKTQARRAGVAEEVMRKRVLRGILNYNVLRDQVR